MNVQSLAPTSLIDSRSVPSKPRKIKRSRLTFLHRRFEILFRLGKAETHVRHLSAIKLGGEPECWDRVPLRARATARPKLDS